MATEIESFSTSVDYYIKLGNSFFFGITIISIIYQKLFQVSPVSAVSDKAPVIKFRGHEADY